MLVTLFMFGLFIATVIMLGWVYKDRMIASTVNMAIHSFLTESPLPEEQKKLIIHQTDRLYTAFLEKKIKLTDMTQVVEDVLGGPMVPVGAVYLSLYQYVDQSELDEAQKAGAKLQIDRMARAGMTMKFTMDELKPIVDQIKTPVDPEHPNQKPDSLIRETLDVETLKNVIEQCRALADKVDEPNEPYVFDVSSHLRKAVDKLLGPEELDKESLLSQ